MFDRKVLTARLSEIGCSEIGPRCYALPSAHPEIEWSVHFRLLGTYRWELDGGLRWSHARAGVFAQECLRKYAGPIWVDSPQQNDGSPLAPFMGWGPKHALVVRDMTTNETTDALSSGLASSVLPIVAAVKDDNAFLELLASGNTPFEWLHCQPLYRYAEAVYLAARLNVVCSNLSARLAEKGAAMRHQLDGIALEAFVHEVDVAAQAA